ncbi:hypothetical protein [Stenotrophomonas sepilia]
MSNDIKTLENAQPGERVRLGDQAERVRFEAWGRAEGLPLARGNFGGYAFEVTAKAWRAWQFLSTQPSPGGQGDAVHCGKCKGGGYVDVDVDESGRSIGNIEACPHCTLAARQPVEEPVAISKDARECLQEIIDNCWRDEDQAVASEIDRLMRGPLYTAPTAQTVDLGPVRVLADHAAGRINHANNGLCPDEVEGQDTRDPDCPVCRALIDSQAVSNG